MWKRIWENEEGSVGYLFLMFTVMFLLTMNLLVFDIGKLIIAREQLRSAAEAGVLAGNQEIYRVDEAWNEFGAPRDWDYHIKDPDGPNKAMEAFNKNVSNMGLEDFDTNVAHSFATIPSASSVQMHVWAEGGLDNFNKAKQVFYHTQPSDSVEIFIQTRSLFNDPLIP
ncbi:MAG: Tad domain-containing protein [Bacillaceae bacterium]|nr:Tad domain-containing protein [Bacillaceae bacterium]